MIKSLPYEATGNAIKGYENSVIAKNETNDCVVRAFASSFEIPYDEAHSIVATKFNRQNRKGTFGTASTLVKISNEKVVINEKKVYLVGKSSLTMSGSLKYDVKVKGVIVKREMTVGKFVKENPTGSFFVIVKGHAFTIKNGVVIGNYEDSQKLKTRLKCAFEIK
jgi:hypothetical protein